MSTFADTSQNSSNFLAPCDWLTSIVFGRDEEKRAEVNAVEEKAKRKETFLYYRTHDVRN